MVSLVQLERKDKERHTRSPCTPGGSGEQKRGVRQRKREKDGEKRYKDLQHRRGCVELGDNFYSPPR